MLCERVLNVKAAIGEGPVWDDRAQCLYFVDILSRMIHRYNPATNEDEIFQLNKMVGAIAICQHHRLITALEDGFAFLDFDHKTTQEIWVNKQNDIRFNDGKCDPEGRFWAGTMSLSGEKGKGTLYCLDQKQKVSPVLSGITTSNGLAFSPDGRYLYYTDSPTLEIWRFDTDPKTVLLKNKQVVVQIPPGEGVPDGMTIDEQGRLWVAQWGGGRICCYDPRTGQKVNEVFLPVEQVSSCTFGGPHLSDLFVTTACQGLSEEMLEKQPDAGALFCIRTKTHGFPTDRYPG